MVFDQEVRQLRIGDEERHTATQLGHFGLAHRGEEEQQQGQAFDRRDTLRAVALRQRRREVVCWAGE